MSAKSKSAPKAAPQTPPTTQNIESLVKASAAAAQETLEKTMAATKTRMDAAVKGLEDIATYSKANVEAVVASGNVTAKALETLNAEVLAYAKQSFEDGIAAAKAMATAKSLQEVLDLQADFSKSALDGFLAQSTKLGEMMTKMSKDAIEPLSARMTATVEKLRPKAA
jgi:phasin family protein